MAISDSLKISNKYQENMEALEQIKENNPTATHVYIRRTTIDNSVIDIPIMMAEDEIKKHPEWEVVTSNKQMDDEVEALFGGEDDDPTVQVPPKPSEKREWTPPKRKGYYPEGQVPYPQVNQRSGEEELRHLEKQETKQKEDEQKNSGRKTVRATGGKRGRPKSAQSGK